MGVPSISVWGAAELDAVALLDAGTGVVVLGVCCAVDAVARQETKATTSVRRITDLPL